MKLSTGTGLATHGARTLIYFILMFLVKVNNSLFTGIVVLALALALSIFAIVICFPETMPRSVKYMAVFETVMTMVVFLGDRFGLQIDFFLGLMLLAGYNLTMILGILADNKQK